MKIRIEETISVTPSLTYDHPFWEFRSDWKPVDFGDVSVPCEAYINALFIIQRVNISNCRAEVLDMLILKIEHNAQIEEQLTKLLGY